MTDEAALRRYEAAIHGWDRVLLRGSRQGLADAAEELQAMGEAGAPWAEKLLRRVAELDADEQRRQRLLEWCDRSPSRGLVVVGEARGTVGWVSTEALPEVLASRQNEDGRRLGMVAIAREARRIEEGATGVPALVALEGLEIETLEDGLAFAWRWDPARLLPSVPERIVAWWQVNRGDVSTRCSLHGEIARFDASECIGMLCPAWDAAVVEYHDRWERRWVDTYDTPEFDGCRVRIEPTSEPGGANLFDVEKLWIMLEGGRYPWWPYQVLPGPG